MDAYSFSGDGPVSNWGIGALIQAEEFPVRFDLATPIQTIEGDRQNEKGKPTCPSRRHIVFRKGGERERWTSCASHGLLALLGLAGCQNLPSGFRRPPAPPQLQAKRGNHFHLRHPLRSLGRRDIPPAADGRRHAARHNTADLTARLERVPKSDAAPVWHG